MKDAQDDSRNERDEATSGTSVAGAGFSVLEIYAQKARWVPETIHFLIVFGIVLVLAVTLGPREPLAVGIVVAALLIAYLVQMFWPARRVRRRTEALMMRDKELAAFLSLGERGGLVGIFVPISEAEHAPRSVEPYLVRSVALAHVQAVVEVVSLLSQLDKSAETSAFEPSNLFVDEGTVDSFRGSTLFLVGGPLPNVFVRRLVDDDPALELEEAGEEIRLLCGREQTITFAIRPPRGGRSIQEVEEEPTYGVIQKVTRGGRATFALWGLDERGTRGAARWLATSWRRLSTEFEGADFSVVVRFPAGRTYAPDDVVRHPEPELPLMVPS